MWWWSCCVLSETFNRVPFKKREKKVFDNKPSLETLHSSISWWFLSYLWWQIFHYPRNCSCHRYKVICCYTMVKNNTWTFVTIVWVGVQNQNTTELQINDSVVDINPFGLSWWHKILWCVLIWDVFDSSCFLRLCANQNITTFQFISAVDGWGPSLYLCILAWACPGEVSEMCAHWPAHHPSSHSSSAGL